MSRLTSMTPRRALKAVCWAMLIWGALAFTTTSMWCASEALPAPIDRRPWPAEFDPLEAWREMDVDVLADVALGEDPHAVAAVVWTVLNRRRDGELIETVVRRGQAFGSVVGGRFRPAWDQVPGRRWSRYYPGEWWRARRIARAVLEHRLPDPTGGATHFHRRGTWRPPWAPSTAEWVWVGRHAFYRAS